MTYPILEKLKKEILVIDGAMGTMIQSSGIEVKGAPEELNLTNPDLIYGIHRAYIEAGADITTANTFGGNRMKLAEFGLEGKIREINSAAVRIARRAAKDKEFVGACIGPTGKFIAPLGDLDYTHAIEIFYEQIKICIEAGADLIIMETFMDVKEFKAAINAAKEAGKVPVAASMTFFDDLRTSLGTTPEIACAVAECMGADLIGANCSLGPEGLLKVMEAMLKVSKKPLFVQPNAGLPELINGKTIYPSTPDEMADYAVKFARAGVRLIGSCCGSTPKHTEAIVKAVKSISPLIKKSLHETAFCSRTNIVFMGERHPFLIVGERINPTGKKHLSHEIKSGRTSFIAEEAIKQMKAGANMLDVNVGVPGIDEPFMMRKAVEAIQRVVDIPLSIDSPNPDSIKAGLEIVDGKALINSVSAEDKKLEIVLPFARKYGAAIIGLLIDEKGIPRKAEDRLVLAEKILDAAIKKGVAKDDVIIDCLTLAVSAEPGGAQETLKAIRLIKEKLGLFTILGVSNVSFGLPDRSLLNATFLSMALGAGLDAAIINPHDLRIHEVFKAAGVLLNRDPQAKRYISFSQLKERVEPSALTSKEEAPLFQRISETVINGDKEKILNLINDALVQNNNPMEISNNALIPALEEMGRLFQTKKVFLPQVLLSAETMQVAFGRLKKELGQAESENKFQNRGTFVIATVEGDIHDIGKNIVGVLLENHGFKVIDLGKNIPASDIVEVAIIEKADIVGLSALMTTTMVNMKAVIEMMREKNLNIPVMVGGAVVTKDFAHEIGAAAYAKDALEAVRIAKSLIMP